MDLDDAVLADQADQALQAKRAGGETRTRIGAH
jgi:hypothetical protein